MNKYTTSFHNKLIHSLGLNLVDEAKNKIYNRTCKTNTCNWTDNLAKIGRMFFIPFIKTEFKCKKIQLPKDWSIFNINRAKKMSFMQIHHNWGTQSSFCLQNMSTVATFQLL